MTGVADVCCVSLTGDLIHCDIVVTVDSLEFSRKVITLHSEAVSIELKIADRSSVHVLILVQVRKLMIDSV